MTPELRRAFAEYFGPEGPRLPQGTLPERGAVSHGRWSVRFVTGELGGQPYLDFYATNRFTNDRHVRVHADGRVEWLEAILDGFSYKDEVPGDRERAEREYFEHNRRVSALLKQKGLL